MIGVIVGFVGKPTPMSGVLEDLSGLEDMLTDGYQETCKVLVSGNRRVLY